MQIELNQIGEIGEVWYSPTESAEPHRQLLQILERGPGCGDPAAREMVVI